MRSFGFALLLVVIPGVRAAPPEPATPESAAAAAATSQATGDDPAAASLEKLLEHMVRSQLGRCPGVEVHKRGTGFIAGRYGGPVVLVSVDGACFLSPLPNGESEVILRTRWATRTPGTEEEIAVAQRVIHLDRLRCPTNYMTALLKREVASAAPGICRDAFTPMREPIPLANFFHPALAPLGIVKMAERDGIGAIVLEHQGRSFELQGTLTCQPVTQEVEGPLLGQTAMRPLHVVANLTLRDVATGEVVGRWHEPIMQNLGINCDVAFPPTNSRVVTAVKTWRERIAERITQARPLSSTTP